MHLQCRICMGKGLEGTQQLILCCNTMFCMSLSCPLRCPAAQLPLVTLLPVVCHTSEVTDQWPLTYLSSPSMVLRANNVCKNVYAELLHTLQLQLCAHSVGQFSPCVLHGVWGQR